METSPKGYELTFEERPEYLHARIAAQKLDRNAALDYLSEISMKCASTRCKQMLLERDIPAMAADADLFDTIKDFVKMGSGIRIAFVNRHVPIVEAMKRVAEFGEGADFKYFDDASEAQQWLVSQ